MQDNGAAVGGVQKSVRTGVANALMALLRSSAPEAAPWRLKVCSTPKSLCHAHSMLHCQAPSGNSPAESDSLQL